MSVASTLHGKRQALPIYKVMGAALLGTAVLAAVLRLMMGGGESSEVLKRYQWERTGKLFVYVEPAAVEDVEFLGALCRHLRDADWCRFLFFDDRANTPSAFPMTDAQTLHFRVKYEYNALQNLDKLVWIRIVDPTASPPGYIERADPPSAWTVARSDGSALAAVREAARRSGATTGVDRAAPPPKDRAE